MQTPLVARPARPGFGPHRPVASLCSRLTVILLLLCTGPAAAAVSPAIASPPAFASTPASAGSMAAAGSVVAAVPVEGAVAPVGSVPARPPLRATAGATARLPVSLRVGGSARLPAPARVVPGRPSPSEGVWPLRPRPAVVAGFDPPATRWGAGHRGVDLAGAPLATVHSSLAGTVTFAGQIAGRGVVVVSHGSTRTTYEPVTALVAVGDRVRAGAVIGRLQLLGSHCFPRWCLHWGLIEGRDHYLDPLTLVGAAPVRLLPLGGAGVR